ncbi:MAG: hypothetical protein AAFV80_01560, partial [Bacteroidota bacterium]
MQYHSPLHILDLDAEKGLDRAALKKAKKRIMAEFELQDSITIDIAGKSYDRQAVIALFESLEQPGLIEHHLHIFSDQELLAFLEHGDLSWFRSPTVRSYQEDKAFANFLGPYFAHQFNQALLKGVKSNRFGIIRTLFSKALPIDDRFEDDCFRSAYRSLIGRVKDLEAIAKRAKKYRMPKSRYSAFIATDVKMLLNALPDYFMGVRDRYAMALHDLGLALFNQHRRGRASIEVVRFGQSLKVDSIVAYNLKYVLDQLEDMTNIWGNPKGGGGSDYSIGWVLFAIFIIARLVMAFADDGPSYNTSFNYTSPTFQSLDMESLGLTNIPFMEPKDKLVLLLDSLEKKNLDIPTDFQSAERPLTGAKPYTTYVNQLKEEKLYV